MKKNSSTVPGISLIPYCYSFILNIPDDERTPAHGKT